MTSSTGEPCHLAGELLCTELLCPASTWGLPWPDMRWPGVQCCRVGLSSQPSGRFSTELAHAWPSLLWPTTPGAMLAASAFGGCKAVQRVVILENKSMLDHKWKPRCPAE